MAGRRSKTKRCSKCGKRKSVETGFYKRGREDQYRSECKTCTKTKRERYVRENLKSLVAQKKKKRAQTRSWFQRIKAGKHCTACGEDDSRCLDFHHRDPEEKEFKLADAVRQGWGRAKILAEIAKCDVLCSNCHRKHHAAN